MLGGSFLLFFVVAVFTRLHYHVSMMNTRNPYHDGDSPHVENAPFAGRREAFNRLYALLASVDRPHGLIFIGRRRVGKTALLHNAATAFRETMINVIRLTPADVTDEATFFLTLASALTHELIDRGFTISRLTQVDPPGDDPRAWFTDTFMPPIIGAARAHRKLVIALDDADHVIEGIKSGALGDDLFTYLDSLTKRFPSIYFAFTLSADAEDDTPMFAPLVGAGDVVRLSLLAQDEVIWLLREPVKDVYQMPDESAQFAYDLTGGEPSLVQRFGYHLFERWQQYAEMEKITPDMIRQTAPTVYLAAELDLRDQWERLNTNERIALTAISRLYYDDAMQRIDAAVVQRWLAETDNPLDLTAVRAALRGLEFREITRATPEGITPTADLMQMWLLEHARPNTTIKPPPTRAQTEAQTAPERRRSVPRRAIRALVVLFIIVVILNIFAQLWVNNEPPPADPAVQPTVTLVIPTPTQ